MAVKIKKFVSEKENRLVKCRMVTKNIQKGLGYISVILMLITNILDSQIVKFNFV